MILSCTLAVIIGVAFPPLRLLLLLLLPCRRLGSLTFPVVHQRSIPSGGPPFCRTLPTDVLHLFGEMRKKCRTRRMTTVVVGMMVVGVRLLWSFLSTCVGVRRPQQTVGTTTTTTSSAVRRRRLLLLVVTVGWETKTWASKVVVPRRFPPGLP